MSLYKFNKDKDYMEERNRLAAAGDKQGAANAERLRNQKIDALGLNYPKTYDYIDIGNEAKTLMQSNAPYQQMVPLASARANKANTNPQYSRFLNDDVQDSMMRYIANGMAGEKPTYQNRRQASIDELYDRVVNGKEFSYDVNSDPAYQAYKDQYTREGQRAMQDTLASLSQDAGGENSWAVSAASQANNRYMQELSDKVPELYNLAYDRYLTERNADMNKLALARDMENAEYGRYLDEMNVYQADRAYADNWYNNYYNQSRQDKQWDYNTANAEIQRYIEAGVMPPADVLQKAGLTGSEAAIQAQVNDVIRNNEFNKAVQGYELSGLEHQKRMDDLQLQEALNQMMYTPSVVKSGGGVGDGDDTEPPKGPEDKVGKPSDDMTDYKITNSHDDTWVAVSGLGRVTWDELEYMILNKKVKAIEDEENKTVSYKKV